MDRDNVIQYLATMTEPGRRCAFSWARGGHGPGAPEVLNS